MSLQSDVYTGFWIDHSRGSVLGATVTLSSKWGTTLISAATVVVSIIGAAVWTIVAFWLHQHRATGNLRDEYDAQMQVLLRNAPAPDMTLWTLLGPAGLATTWHGHKQKVWSKTLKLALAPALVWAAFTLAGIFVGRIAMDGDKPATVLLNNGTCGYIDYADDTTAGALGYSHILINVSTTALQYARQCYTEGQDSAISCNFYAQRKLPYTTNTSQSCPFAGESVCFDDDEASAPVTFTTSLIDSHHDLGINAPAGDRVLLQKRATFAPIEYSFVDRFIEESEYQSGDPRFGNTTMQEYYFGTWTQPDSNSSFLFNYAPIIQYWGLNAVGYGINAYQSLFPHSKPITNWIPTAPFNETPGDLTLFSVFPNAITYTGAVADAMFRTNSTPDSNLQGGAPYRPLRSVYIMTCVEEHQLCNPANGRCTGFQPALKLDSDLNNLTLFDSPNTIAPLDLNTAQNATAGRLIAALEDATMYSAVRGVPDPLLASSYLSSATGSQPLPRSQWQREAEGWFTATLSKLQQVQTLFVHIPTSYAEANGARVLPPQTLALAAQCAQQRVLAPQQFQNYNVFALVFVFCFGIIIPTIAACLRGLHSKLPRFNPNGFRYRSYQAEGVLQLHRMALEGAGYRGWKNGVHKDIPYTELAEERLPQVVVELGEEEEPMLLYPRRRSSGAAAVERERTEGEIYGEHKGGEVGVLESQPSSLSDK